MRVSNDVKVPPPSHLDDGRPADLMAYARRRRRLTAAAARDQGGGQSSTAAVVSIWHARMTRPAPPGWALPPDPAAA